MGFDLYGLAPRSEDGQRFRNSVWWWRPLADYVLSNVEIAGEESKEWGYNDGRRVSEKTALTIAEHLEELVASGKTKRYERKYRAWLESLPMEECKSCGGSGERNDEFVQGRCNGCDGKGLTRPWVTNYPFSVENVREFARFCRESGGFEIW